MTTNPTTSPPAAVAVARPAESGRAGGLLAWVVVLGLCGLHTWGVWLGAGGWKELTSDWPLAFHDHPLYFHQMKLAPAFFRQNGTTAGYDPSFMAGYASSMWFPQSATLFNVVGLLGERFPTAQLHKWTVFAITASLPFLFAMAGALLRLRPQAIALGLALFQIYTWTDGGGAGFPLAYAGYGMGAYLLSVPMALVASATIARYLARGGLNRWLAVVWGSALTWMVHITTPLLVLPAALGAYLVAIGEGRRRDRPLPRWRHVGLWGALPAVALLNAFWWWPGIWLAATRTASTVAFVHKTPQEAVWVRLTEIVTTAPQVQAIILALMIPGLVLLARRDRLGWATLLGFAAAGFVWGYLAGGVRALDFLQPGRHTFGLYMAGALASGVALDELLRLARPGRGRLDLWLLLGLVFTGIRVFGPMLDITVRERIGLSDKPALISSKPTPRLEWIVEQVREHVRPGERLLYEEAGIPLPNVPDPYEGGRFSGLLPHLTGVEVLGGPYLKVALTTNFTQFGAGVLFGRSNWDEAYFRRYAAMYRPSAILCWSPRAVAFCRTHPDLIEIIAEHREEVEGLDVQTMQLIQVPSVVLFGRVKGFGGETIRGRARVQAEPGRLHVSGAVGDELDGLVVLRYHSVPNLRANPTVELVEVPIPHDPVPFIGFRPPPGKFTLELDFPP